MTKQQMMSYLSQILSLEMKLYEMDQIRNQYCYHIQKLQDITQQNLFKEQERPKNDWGSMILFSLLYGVVAFVGSYFVIHFLQPPTKVTVFGCVFIAVAVFVGTIGWWFYGTKEDQNVWQQNNNRIRENNARIKTNAQNANREIQIINSEISRLDQNYDMLLDTLDRLYDANVIYPKYRYLVAISSFYEYFSSGRCSQLQGHEGAYNIYENELMGRTIIGKLDDILYSLDSIRDNQYLLYSELQKSNQTVNRLSTTINNAVYHLEDISRKQDILAYNTEVTRKNTEVIKWISMCDYLNIR